MFAKQVSFIGLWQAILVSHQALLSVLLSSIFFFYIFLKTQVVLLTTSLNFLEVQVFTISRSVCKDSTSGIKTDCCWAIIWMFHLLSRVLASSYTAGSGEAWGDEDTGFLVSPASLGRLNCLTRTKKHFHFLVLLPLGQLLDAAVQVGILLIQGPILPVPPMRSSW